MASERTLPGETPLGSVRAEESLQCKLSGTMSVMQEEWGEVTSAGSESRLAACREPEEEIWSEHADST